MDPKPAAAVILALGLLSTPGCASTPAVAGAPGQVVVKPETIERQEPVYPPELRAAGVEGEVVARAVIGQDGRVRDIEIVRTDHPLFTEALLEAVPGWRFRPATVDGLPIEVDYTLVQQFKLDQ